MNQKKRNNIAVKIAKLLKKEKANIFDSLNILQNLEDAYIKEVEFNINSMDLTQEDFRKLNPIELIAKKRVLMEKKEKDKTTRKKVQDINPLKRVGIY